MTKIPKRKKQTGGKFSMKKGRRDSNEGSYPRLPVKYDGNKISSVENEETLLAITVETFGLCRAYE